MPDTDKRDLVPSLESLAREVAAVTQTQHADVLSAINEVKQDVKHIEAVASEALSIARKTDAVAANALTVATDSLVQARLTNGHVTALRLWQAEVRGIAQGSGGMGRLLAMLLASAAATGGIITTTIMVLDK